MQQTISMHKRTDRAHTCKCKLISYQLCRLQLLFEYPLDLSVLGGKPWRPYETPVTDTKAKGSVTSKPFPNPMGHWGSLRLHPNLLTAFCDGSSALRGTVATSFFQATTARYCLHASLAHRDVRFMLRMWSGHIRPPCSFDSRVPKDIAPFPHIPTRNAFNSWGMAFRLYTETSGAAIRRPWKHTAHRIRHIASGKKRWNQAGRVSLISAWKLQIQFAMSLSNANPVGKNRLHCCHLAAMVSKESQPNLSNPQNTGYMLLGFLLKPVFNLDSAVTHVGGACFVW